MRLIDADALHYNRIRIAHSDGTIGGYNAVVMSAEIKDAPTIDAVPVVRCGDCKYHKSGKHLDNMRFCYRLKDNDGESVGYLFDDDDFCSQGERREE